MSAPKPPKLCRPFANYFYTDSDLLDRAIRLLDDRLGERCFTSDAAPFELSKYYEREMGRGIMRMFTAWKRLIDPIELVDIKLLSWEIEEKLKQGKEGRLVNIDPGIVTEGYIALATGKAVGHRQYLGRGVFSDLTLIYQSGTYRQLEWTYPDYAGEDIIAMMNRLRTEYLKDRGAG